MFKIQLMYPKLKINVYFIFLNIGDLTFGITLVGRWGIPDEVFFYGQPLTETFLQTAAQLYENCYSINFNMHTVY
jgi:hypothetical protein